MGSIFEILGAGCLCIIWICLLLLSQWLDWGTVGLFLQGSGVVLFPWLLILGGWKILRALCAALLSDGEPPVASSATSVRRQSHEERREEQIERDNGGSVQARRNADRTADVLSSDEEAEEIPTLRSRDANRPCQCGSGKKAKKCCFAIRSAVRDSTCQAKKEILDTTPDPLLEQWRSEMEVVCSGSSSNSKARGSTLKHR